MEKDLRIKISIDKKTGNLKVIGSEFNDFDKKVNRSSKSVVSLKTTLTQLATGAIGIYAINAALSDLIQTGLKIESMTMSLEAAVGGIEEASQSMQFLKKTTDELGLSFEASLDGFTQFSAAAKQTSVEGQGVEDIFSGVAKASTVMGLSVDDQNGVFRALSQMMSKGKVQAEELRGQLGERLPGAFQIAARSMNMTTGELDKFMSDGKLISDDFLPKFGRQLEVEFGEKAVKASQTARAEQSRYNNELLYMKTAIYEAGLEEFTKDFYQLGSVVLKEATHWLHEYNIQAQSLKDVKFDAGLETLNEQLKLAQDELFSLELQTQSIDKIVTTTADAWEATKVVFGKYAESEVSHNAKVIEQKAIISKIEKAITKSKQDGTIVDISEIETGAGGSDTSDVKTSLSTSLDDWKEYYKTINDYENAWLIEEAQLRTKFTDLSDEQFSSMAVGAKTNFYDSIGSLYSEDVKAFEDAEAKKLKIAEDAEAEKTRIAEESENKKLNLQAQFLDVVTSDTDKINDRYMEIYEASEGYFSEDKMQIFFEKWNDELDGINDKNQVNLGNQLDAYSSLAGSMSNMYEEGSNSARNFALIQQGLAVASGVNAILTQAAGDPYSAFARMAAMTVSVVSLLSNIGQTISGSGGSDSGPSSYETNIQDINDTNDPILDRLDRQIELLESIDGYGGTAVSTTLERAKLQFETDYSIAVEEGLSQGYVQYGEKTNSNTDYAEIASALNKQIGADIFTIGDKYIKQPGDSDFRQPNDFTFTYLDEEVARESTNYLAMLKALKDFDLLDEFQYTEAEYTSIVNELEQANHDYAMSLLDNIKTLTDASNDFKDAYDGITGTTTYKDQTLSDAKIDVYGLQSPDKTDVDGLLSPGQSLEEYLVKYIDDIAAVESVLTPDAIETMLAVESDVGFDAVAQQDLYNQVAAETGVILENGALEALNYKDSLLLVADSMAESNKNIDVWTQRNETVEETAQRLSNTLGVDLVQSTSELDTLATTLIASNGELTSAELEVLQANESYLYSLGLVEEAVVSIAETEEIIANEKLALEDRLFNLTATNLELREKELSLVDESNRSVLESIYAEEDRLELLAIQESLYESQTSMLTDLKLFADDLLYNDLGTTYGFSNSANLLDASIVAFTDKLADDEDTSLEIANIKKYSVDALEYSKTQALTTADYMYDSAVMSNKLNELADLGSEMTLTDVVSELQDLKDKVSELLQSTKEVAENTEVSRYA